LRIASLEAKAEEKKERPAGVGLEERFVRGKSRSEWERIMGQNEMEAFVFPFEKLEVWQLAVDLADFIFKLLEAFPPNKHFRIVSQLEAAVTGISQNIAEGKGRQYKKEFLQFLYIAEGSLFETLTLTEVMRRRKLISDADAMEIRERCVVIDRKLHGLINSVRGRN
jgi:four helix bundle protein